MLENIMTDDRKIDEIYRIVKNIEARERRAFWRRIVFRLVFLMILVFGFLNFSTVLQTITSFLMPMVTKVVEQTLQEKGNTLLEGADNLKASVLQSVKKSLKTSAEY